MVDRDKHKFYYLCGAVITKVFYSELKLAVGRIGENPCAR